MRSREWLLLLALSVLWGATFVFSAIAVKSLPPLTLVLLRVGLAAAVLVPLTSVLGYRLPADRSTWLAFAVLAIFSNLLPFFLMFYGQARISAGLASVINSTTPLFAIIIARLFGNEPLTGNRIAGILLGILGVAILMGPATMNVETSSLVGMACLLGAAFSYGVSALLLRRFRDIPPLVSASAQLLCASVMVVPLVSWIDRPWLLEPPPLAAVAAVLCLALLSTALAYVIFFRISAAAGGTNVMLVTLLVPITATGLGALLLEESLAPHQIAGALVIASGLLVIDGRLVHRMRSKF